MNYSQAYKHNHAGKPLYLRAVILFMCLIFTLPLFLTGCGSEETAVEKHADYGDYGALAAKALASRYPYRKAYSETEKSAGTYIKNEFEELGYKVEEQTFSSAGNTGTSTNYIVRIPGTGLMFLDSDESYIKESRQVIVGAHYDTEYGTEDAAAYPDFNGIQDNACGIGCLLTIAKEIRSENNGYDVILVAFGAGDDSYTGARAFADSMTESEISSTDAMYCIESIYAGDKLYANAGWNSLVPGQKYEMRRKLYEAYDVVYENQLSSSNGVDLLYNECGQFLDVDGDGDSEVFREVTTTLSDYVPFDNAGIPIVFFESYDYNYSTISEMKETKNLHLQENGGLIRRTNYDSISTLLESMAEGQLELRINNTAFIIIEAILKGAHDSISVQAYKAGETIAPPVHVSVTPTPAATSVQK